MQLYESTRDRQIQLEPSQAILQGLSTDGGLFVLRELGTQKIDLTKMMRLTYQEMAQEILTIFLQDFSPEEIKAAVKSAYADHFDTVAITPLVNAGGAHILELFHGPTSAFKDVGLTMLPQLLTRAVQKRAPGKQILILTATSGDTGKAALEGFKDVSGVQIMVFYPEGGVSAVQEQQMKTQAGDNVAVCAVSGNFDEAQSEIKRLFLETDFQKQLAEQNIQLSSANSINIGRLIPQVVYYFSAYAQMIQTGTIKLGDRIDFVVPTGNFGNILAGYYARELGLPIERLICAANENNVLHEFIESGVYDRKRPFLQTNSPSMDILISSNLERLLYYLSGKNNQQVAQWMADLQENGRYEIPSELKEELQQIFSSGFTTEQETNETIQSVYQQTGYLLDPHTAVAYKVWREQGQERPAVILATASPYKFSQTVFDALDGDSSVDKDEFQVMNELHEETGVPIPSNLASLKEQPIRHQETAEINEMKDFVLQHLKKER